LPLVRKPARYTGGEWNQVIKDEALIRMVLAYPDVYEVGMSNLGLRILYEIVNADPRFAAERVFSPWDDMRELMDRVDLPLLSLETKTPVADFDVFGISLQSELTYSNVIGLLDAARIPRRSGSRGDNFPLVIAGGPCAFNPEPLSPFFDAFVIGEAEEALPEMLDMLAEFKTERGAGARVEQGQRQALLESLARIEGVYVPALPPVKIRKRSLSGFDRVPSPSRPIVPFLETIHDRCVIEVMRGCSRGCRFCQAGIIYRPVRERSAETVGEAALEQARHTGYDDISLASLSTTDHSQINEILKRISELPVNYARSISLPSMRTDRFSVSIAEAIAAKKTGITFAPEAGTDRMRAVINKGLSEADVTGAARSAFAAGWERIKFYFMIGLPGETDEDVVGIADLVEKVLAVAAEELGPKRAKRVKIVVSASTFVPKSHTPFQWVGAISLVEIERRQQLLKDNLPGRRVEFKWHEAGGSLVEAALARGGRETADVIERAYDLGTRFDGWSDKFSLETWQAAFEQLGLDLEQEATADFDQEKPLPWDHIDCGIDPAWLRNEYQKALAGKETADCRTDVCSRCGVCDDKVRLELAGRNG
jgi:radical SAM family uncharacterized protein